ncbi:hypothetical protein K3X16_14765, partial [Listeria monocytogenes]|nr:hypothetical protein [Listeria monocytogenes]
SQWSNIAYQFGPASDQLWVRAFNGVSWSTWAQFAAIPEGPVVTVADVTAWHGQSFAVSSLFTYYDPFGFAAAQYDV